MRMVEFERSLPLKRIFRLLWSPVCSAVLVLFLAVAWCSGARAQPVVTDVRAGAHEGKLTRLVLDLSEKISADVFTLNSPDRVVLDLPEVGWRLPQKPLPTAVGLMARMRYGLFKPGTSRVVLDMTEAVAVEKMFVLPPRGNHGHRLVVDVRPLAMVAPGKRVEKRASQKPTVRQASLPSAPITLRDPQVRKEKPVIVIDAGHGGVDPGTHGRSGIYEKHITLAAARVLAEKLRQTGRYKVVLTRDRDIFLRLRQRIHLAREAKGDLFMSLHADSIRNPRIRGLSVYTLSENASDKEAALLAEKENKADLIAGIDLTAESPEVTNILIDLAQRETMNQSATFATGLVGELRRKVNLLRRTHRFAGFAVLKAPDIPSVLVELGFLSNKADERNLRSKAYLEKLANALVRGIGQYFEQVQEAQQR